MRNARRVRKLKPVAPPARLPQTRCQRWTARLVDGEGVTRFGHPLALLLATILLFSREPSLFLLPQFYAEDGSVWYAQAWNGGWFHSLTLEDGGYLNTLQRLGTGPALLLPLLWAPLWTVIFGLLIQLLPIPVLLSRRARHWGPLPLRALFTLLYVLLPNAREIHVVLTNSQWHLALVAVLLVFAAPPVRHSGRVFDLLVFLISSVSGPFCIVLLPLIAVFLWLRRQGWTLVALLSMSLGVLVQLNVLYSHQGERTTGPLGASPAQLIRILGGNVAAGAILPGASLRPDWPLWSYLPPLILASSLCFLALRRAPMPLRFFILFAASLLIPELHSPLIAGVRPLWQLLAEQTSHRYWFFPQLAFLWAAAWGVLNARRQAARIAGAAVLALVPFAAVLGWRYNPLPDEHWPASVERFQHAPPGEPVTLPIPPEPTVMILIRK